MNLWLNCIIHQDLTNTLTTAGDNVSEDNLNFYALNGLPTEFNLPHLYCDNLPAIVLMTNSVFHTRTKHIAVDFHLVREKAQSKEQINDILCLF